MRKHGSDTVRLLHDVYKTYPMLRAAPGEVLDFNPPPVEDSRKQRKDHNAEFVPISKTKAILRLDQLQPIGRHGESFELTRFRLSMDALAILDEWMSWLLTGDLPTDGGLAAVRAEFLQPGF